MKPINKEIYDYFAHLWLNLHLHFTTFTNLSYRSKKLNTNRFIIFLKYYCIKSKFLDKHD